MGHNVGSKQKVKILTVQIAVPADLESGECADAMSALLTENGVYARISDGKSGFKPWILDWKYVKNFDEAPTVKASADPEEGEIFNEIGETPMPEKRIIVYIPETGWVKGRGHKVAFVTENEPGYSTGEDAESCKAAWYWGNGENCAKSLEEAKKTAVAYNAKLGIDEKTALDILLSSMRASNMLKKGR